MYDFPICDLHCDTVSYAYDHGLSIYDNSLCANILKMKKFSNFTQVFAIFVSPKYYDNPQKRCKILLDYINNEIKKYPDDICICKNFSDILHTNSKKKISSLLSIEGGEGIYSISDMEYFYSRGVRIITPSWNNENHIASENGLSPFGKELLKKMNETGIIYDLSHASKNTFSDVLSLTKKPVILSHSNSFSICPHKRNITDEQFLQIKKINGVVGINFYPPFLNKKGNATIDDVILHIMHFLSLNGENNICIGSDFDGASQYAKGLSSVSDILKIFDILAKKGVSREILKKIAYKNAYRVMNICL